MAKSKESKEETVAGYFRKVFAENPKWLHGRSNDALLKRWLDDHPGHSEVPKQVKANLQNIKSVLRKKARKKGGRPKKSAAPAGALVVAVEATQMNDVVVINPLEPLEEMIDECLSMAKSLDREGLYRVISLLRQARNLVVWEQGA
jgi:hypothetical protein